MPELNVRSILCRLADVQKNIILMLRKLQKRVWKGAGDSHQGSTYPYSEMPGELKKDMDYKNEKHEKAMKAPIDQDAIRKAGW